jgi:hypothetical protein
MKNFTSIICVCLIVGAGALHHLFAQVVVEQPIISPTYIAVPPVQQEVITTAPAPNYVWVSGHWNRTPSTWQWNAGTWVQPPFGNAYWVPGYWQHRGGKYVWQTAHWAAANQGVVVAKPVTMPTVYEELKPAAPAQTNVVWQPGHWEWRGSWFWIPGEYVTSAVPSATWVPGQWVAGIGGNWQWSPAHWAVS